MTSMTKFKWFWAWEDEKEEAWLREMAQNGWHLVQVSFPNVYTFEQGAPRDVVYRLDFFTRHLDKANYLQLFSDAGWEHFGEYGSWQYFRKEVVPGEADEIFTDNESKAKKYQRILVFLVLFFSTLGIILSDRFSQSRSGFYQALMYFLVVMLALMLYGIVMLWRRIRELRRQ